MVAEHDVQRFENSCFLNRARALFLSKGGWSLDWVSALDCEGRTIWIVDAHLDDGKRFVVRADEKLIAVLELESATRIQKLEVLRSPGTESRLKLRT